MSTLAALLEKTNSSLEPRFVKVGEDLQSIFFDSGRLEQETTQAAKLVGRESDSSVLRNIDVLAQESISELRLRQESISQNLETSQAVVDHLQQLQPKSGQLTKLAKHLRAISICFSIESSRSNESIEMFSAFTKKMNDLVSSVFQITDNIRSDSFSAGEKQTYAMDCVSKGTDELHTLVAQADEAVKDASQRMDKIVSLSVAALEKIGQQSSQIAKQISSIVMAIQFHDITRQQVEHIISALRDEVELLQELESTQENRQDAEQAAIARISSVLALQVAQLEQVILSIRKAHGDIESSFLEIGHASSILAESTSEANTKDAQEDPFLDLKYALENLGQLLGKGRELSGRTSEADEQASKASIVLSRHTAQIREINTDIGIQALNAIINSVRLGEKGRVLATLAQEVTQLSNRCSGYVESIVESLDSIISLVERSSNMANGDSADNADHYMELEAGIKDITKAYTEFKKYSLSAMKDAVELESAVSCSKSGLEFLSDVENEFNICLKDMQSLLETLCPDGKAMNIADLNAIDGYAERYTMKSERDIHLKMLDGGGISGEAAPDDNVTSQPSIVFFDDSEDDELGDNVELF